MSDTDPQRQRLPLTGKRSGPTDAPRSPTETAARISVRGQAKTASLTSDMIQVGNSQRRPKKNLPGVEARENRKDPTHGLVDVVAQNEMVNVVVDKIGADELSIGAIAMLWSRESEHGVSEIVTELLAAFQERLKDCSMEKSKDATVSRQELLKFCEDAGIDPPRFWASVTKP